MTTSPLKTAPSREPVVTFRGRLAIRQRVITDYRARLFDLIAPQCSDGLTVLAGTAEVSHSLKTVDRLQVAVRAVATNRNLLSGAAQMHWQPELLDWLNATNPRVLITDANPRLLDTSRAIRWMHGKGRAVIGWGLGTMQLTPGFDHLRDAVRRRHLRRFDGLIAYSEVAAEQYAAAGYPAERIYVAHNAAVTPPAGECPVRAPEFQGAPKLLFIGRLIEGKRLEDLLHACAGLEETLRPTLQIVGDGPLGKHYEQLAARVYPNTQFLGARRGADLAAVCRDADLFVLPGKGGLAIQEAMCYGLPVIATTADGTERDLVRAENGWLFREGDVADMQNALREALRSAARLREMGRASFRIVRDEINLVRMAQELVHAAAAFAG